VVGRALYRPTGTGQAAYRLGKRQAGGKQDCQVVQASCTAGRGPGCRLLDQNKDVLPTLRTQGYPVSLLSMN
jgi:hypothetical protein